MPDIQKDANEAIRCICEGIANPEKKLSDESIEALKKLVNNAETYNLFIQFQFENSQRPTLKAILKDYVNPHRATDVFLHYDYMNRHLSGIFEKYCGMECSVDRSRHVLRMYLSFLKNGKLPTLGNRKDYWVPPFGTVEEWMKLCSAIQDGFYHFPFTDGVQEAYETIYKAGEKYEAKREAEEKAFWDTLEKTTIDFAQLADLKMPCLVKNMEEGRMFAILYDRYVSREKDPQKSIREFYINGDPDGTVITIEKGELVFTPLNKWRGDPTISFTSLVKCYIFHKPVDDLI